jgi:hypothetical protein
VARLPGQVATRRTDLEYSFVADLLGAGFRTPGFAHVPDAGARDRYHPCIARLAVVRRDRRGAVEGLAIRVGTGRALEDDVAAGHPTARQPPIVGPGHLEAQKIVVSIGPADQDLPPPWQRGGAQAALLGMRR